ncbi:MAG: hypothetical protein P8168_11180 [Deltaproteobacteria bacterium]|jgi:uncharacterized membrane protein YtjA (UPF0391 family)
MRLSGSDVAAIIAILAGLVGFTFAGPGNVQQIAQGVFYVFTVVFFVTIFKRFWRRPKQY